MTTAEARQLVQKTFQNPFDKGQFVYFIKDLVNEIDEEKAFHARGYVHEKYRDRVKTYERVGTYTDPEDNKVDILIVYLQKESSIDRVRTTLRNFVGDYLKERGEKEAGLIAFVSPNQKDWRFSLVKMEYKITETPSGRVKAKEEFTPAKRYSFLVGVEETSHTAQSRLVPILEDDTENPTLKQIEEAFNIEKVTKEFFEKYRDLYLRVKETLDDVLKNDKAIKADFAKKNIDTVDFGKKLLGQIVFLYFLQKKGWFGVKRGEAWGSGSKNFLRELFDKKHGDYKNFFNDTLEPLFYEALRNDRSHDDHYFSMFKCKIPFLNGGLFDPINNYDWKETDIILPNDLFSNSYKTKEGDIGTGILDIFDRYNFTVKEDEPLEKEVAVDPEMLGKVFENLLEVKDRKSKGTYYTPREIVHYMCQESLVNYLATELDKKVSKKDIETLIKYGETVVEHEAEVESRGKETKTYSHKLPRTIRDNAKLIDEKLETIRICDPAVGSGAFPVRMMNEIICTRNALTSYLKTKKGRAIYDFKRHAIQNCLYGVDIDLGAVEIAKLRLWLSLIVDEEDIKQIKPLPNLDYKIMQGNSLLEEFEGIKIFDEKLLRISIIDSEILDPANHKIIELQGKLLQFYQKNPKWMQKGEHPDKPQEVLALESQLRDILKRRKKIQQQSTEQKDLFTAVAESRAIRDELENHHKQFFGETNPERKRELKKKIENLEWELIETTLKEQNKISVLKKLEEFKRSNIKPFFLWKFNFADVFEEKGGFDVVIANPPYVDSERMTLETPEIRELISSKYITAKGNWDLYIPFWELGFNLLNDSGGAVFITPNKWLAIGYGKALRELLRSYIYKIGNCDLVKVFEAGNSPVVVFASKFNTKGIQIDRFFENFEVGDKFEAKRSLLNEEVWGFLLSKYFQLILKIKAAPQKVSAFYYAENPFTVSEAYEFQKILTDLKIIKDFKSSQYFKFVNTGTIEKYYFLWALETTKYLKRKYFVPVVDRKKFSKKFPKRFIQMNAPKIIISGMRNFECALDMTGEFIAGKSTVILKSKEDADLLMPLAIFNSELISFYIKESFGVLGIGGGINFTADLVESLPLPTSNKKESRQIINLAEKTFAITDGEDYLKNNTKQAKVYDYEKQIDQLVYKLYDLTPEEIKIVENAGG